MDYPRYRREGLPVTPGRVESLIKQFNRRVKGTEKAWNPDQAEMILSIARGAIIGRRPPVQAPEEATDQPLPAV